MKITKETTIPELLEMDARAARILMESGMNCVLRRICRGNTGRSRQRTRH